jgi:RNA polymerase sigma-70 factor (ECF subfamily)
MCVLLFDNGGNPDESRVRVADRELIARVLSGDATAERELYDTHVDRVFRLAYRLADGDADLAQDFTQESFVRAFDRLSDFRGDSALSTWLHAITVSVGLNGMRKVKRWRERETELDDTLPVTHAVRQAEPDLKLRLREAIARLPERYRVVFVMYDVEGYSHEEIGEVLDMPTGTSKARLSRARAKLRDALSQFAGEWTQ